MTEVTYPLRLGHFPSKYFGPFGQHRQYTSLAISITIRQIL